MYVTEKAMKNLAVIHWNTGHEMTDFSAVREFTTSPLAFQATSLIQQI